MVSEKFCNSIKWQTLGGGSNLTMCCSVCFRRTCTQHCPWDRRELETLAGTKWGASFAVTVRSWQSPGGDAWPRGCVVTCSWEKVLSHRECTARQWSAKYPGEGGRPIIYLWCPTQGKMAVRQRETQGRWHTRYICNPHPGCSQQCVGESSGEISHGDNLWHWDPGGSVVWASCVTTASVWVVSCVTTASVWVASCGVTTASVWVASCVTTTSQWPRGRVVC